MAGDRVAELEPVRQLSRLLRESPRLLVERWERRVLGDPPSDQAHPAPAPVLRSHVTALVDRIAADLERVAREPAASDQGRAGEHVRAGPGPPAGEPAPPPSHLPAALAELVHLRRALLELCAAEGVRLEGEALCVVHAALDEAVVATAGALAQGAIAAGKRERERLDLTLRLLPVGVFIADAEGRMLAINDAAMRIWGPQVPLAQSVEEYGVYRAYRPGQSEPIASGEWGLARALRGESPLDEDIEIVSFGGERRTIVNCACALRDPDGTITGGVAVNVDVTDRRRAELERARDAEFRERFIGILGHDLRTPLSAIVLAAQGLLRDEELEDPALRALGRITRSAGRMERMIHDLLDFARTRHGGGIPLTPVACDLVAICRHVLDEVNLTHPDRAVELCCLGSAEGRWDLDRIAQVVQNLVVNALDYSPADKLVRVAIEGAGERVVLAVTNEGEPIPEQARSTLFDPFRRGAHAIAERGAHGLGLGLYIAHEIVRAHHGRMTVESGEATGTTFLVELPRAASGKT